MDDEPRMLRLMAGAVIVSAEPEEAIRMLADGAYGLADGQLLTQQETNFYHALRNGAWARAHGRWPKLSDF